MPTKKRTTTSKTSALKVEIAASKPRKRNVVSRTAFKPGNEHRIRPGEVRNPNGRKGKAKPEDALVSKALTVQLRDRAPDRVCEVLGLPSHSSWAQCLAQKLLRTAVSGDMHAGGPGTVALEMLVRLTEQHGGKPGELAQAALDGPQRAIEICFVESDGDGRLKPADMEAGLFSSPPTIQGQSPRPMLPGAPDSD